MDCWHPITVRAQKPDAIQRWAELEAKSPLMRDELAQRFALRKPRRQRPVANTAFTCELIVLVLKAWLYIQSG